MQPISLNSQRFFCW